jgi:Type IV secretion-system coupling protein DNA-binding domain
VPLSRTQGQHVLVTGSTGSGKTVSLRRIATDAIAQDFSVVIIDAKGGVDFLGDVHHAAVTHGHRFIQWSFKGPWTYNAYGSGTASEIAARLLFDEITEPYYLRIFQRHLQQVVAAIQAAGLTPSLRLVAYFSQSKNWGGLIDRLSGEAVHRFAEYLDSLTPRIVQDLTGSISRLATLDESDIGEWLAPEGADRIFDLREAMDRGDVVLFRLDSDGQPEPSRMFGAALIQDLVSIAGTRQGGTHRPVLVIIDEFPAIAAPLSVNLLERGRSANYSVLLGVQDMAGIDPGGDAGLVERIVGNLTALIVHRQVVPSSRELICKVIGTVPSWSRTRQVRAGLGATGLGSLTREREFPLHPDDLSSLEPGEAYVLLPGTKRPYDRARVFRPFFGWNGGAERPAGLMRVLVTFFGWKRGERAH